MTWYDMIWDEMRWDDMTWDEMRWHDMIRCDITWGEMWRHDVTCMRWHDNIWDEMNWYDMRWNEMRQHDMTWEDIKWDDLTWYEMIWHEMTWYDMMMRCPARPRRNNTTAHTQWHFGNMRRTQQVPSKCEVISTLQDASSGWSWPENLRTCRVPLQHGWVTLMISTRSQLGPRGCNKNT